jgi:hypothetical protein
VYSVVLRNLPWPPFTWFYVATTPRSRDNLSGRVIGRPKRYRDVDRKEPGVQPWMRACDADRQRVVDVLRRHTAEGRPTLDEFTARTDAAYHAVTHADLTILAADLPDEPARRKPSPGPVAAALVVAAV